jgi:hypothetical protein
MDEPRKPALVAVNVMRTRVTVVGFNIAIIAFQLAELQHMTTGRIDLPSIGRAIHFDADIALFMALALSVTALVAFVTSSAYDPVGVCTHWSLVAGDLLMYLALAETAAAFFEPLMQALALTANDFSQHQPAFQAVYLAMLIAGGTAWFLTSYVGPVIALLRSPFGTARTLVLTMFYIALILALAWVRANSSTLQSSREDNNTVDGSIWIELAAPLSWGARPAVSDP